MIIRMNGTVIYEEQSLLDKLNLEIEKTKEKMNTMSREARRSKAFKQILSIIALIGSIGVVSTEKAFAMEPVLATMNMNNLPGIGSFLLNGFSSSIDKEDSIAWKLSKYMSDVLFRTEDFFDNPSIVHMWNVVWYIVMSMTTLVVGKKGFDMIKASALGSNSHQGIPEFIIRLLASMLMTFLSLDVMSAGIELSNIITKLLIGNFSKGSYAIENMYDLAITNVGSTFWLIGFIILFFILGLRYWVRQLNLIVLGLMTPVASLSWVTDGGAMLGTLIRETIVSLTTPMVQALTLSLGTTVLFEVITKTGEGFGSFISSMLIGLSTMFLMIVTPEFLRKFAHGSANPLAFAFNMIMKTKAMPLRFMKMFK